jgi:hypothetical protein
MERTETGVVQEDQPDVRGDRPALDDLADDVAIAYEAVESGLDRSVSRRVGLEVHGAVFRKKDFEAASVGMQKFSGVIAAGDRDRVDSERAYRVDDRRDSLVGEVSGIGVDRSIAHGGA